MEKYTVLYSRVSSDKQVVDGTSLQSQEEILRRKAKEFNVPEHLIKVFPEEGFSGEDIDRPRMNEVRELVVNNQVERIIIVHPDRLSRNMVDRLVVCAEFEKYEVELVFCDTEYKHTPEGQLFFNLQSSIAEYELSLIKKRTRRGSIKSAENGKIMGMKVSPYGYDYIGRKEAQSKKEEGTLKINQTEAEFVKKIFQWYVYDKLTIREIGERLCSLGAIPKRKNIPEWSASSIHNILKSETYVGKFYYNRRQTKKIKGEKTASGKPKRTYEVRDKEEWIEISVPVIIDPVTFALATEQREKNFKHAGNIKHEYLLRQKIRCGHCGNKFASYTSSSKVRSRKTGEITSEHSYKMYRCTNKVKRKFGEGTETCKSKTIRADYIEEYLWENLIMKILNHTDEVIESLKNKYEKPSPEIEETYNLLKFKIAKLEEEKKRVVQLFKKAYIDEDEMDRDINKIQSGIKDLKKEMEKYEQQILNIGKSELSINMLKEQVELVRIKINKEDELTFKVKRQLIDTFIDEIIVKWNEDGSLNVVTVGMIEFLTNDEQLRELGTQQEADIDTTNIVFSVLFDTLFNIEENGRDRKMTVIKQELKIS